MRTMIVRMVMMIVKLWKEVIACGGGRAEDSLPPGRVAGRVSLPETAAAVAPQEFIFGSNYRISIDVLF